MPTITKLCCVCGDMTGEEDVEMTPTMQKLIDDGVPLESHGYCKTCLGVAMEATLACKPRRN